MTMMLFTNTIMAGMYVNVLGVHDKDDSDLWNPRFRYCYQMRGPRGVRDQSGFTSGWTKSMMLDGNPGDSSALLGTGNMVGGLYDDNNLNDTGAQRLYFLHGIFIDNNSNPLAGATCEVYLTSTDQVVGKCITDTNGIYSVGSSFFGQNHYVVGNYGPNTNTGASVNTLQPTVSPW